MVQRIITNAKEAKVENEELRKLPRKDYGVKILRSKLGDKVVEMIRNVRQAGSVVNYNIAIAIGEGIDLADDGTLLKENDGSLNLEFSWCQSIFRRIGFNKK